MATPPLHPQDPNSSNCDKISSNCVIWQGADIPCLDLCTGDTIDIVVSKLAVIICEISNLVDLDFSCLLAPGETSPETITEIAELIISNICDLSGTTAELRTKVNELIVIIENPGNPLNPIIPLPPGLYYYDTNGDLITQLPLTDYAYYLASKLVDVIAFNDYYKQQQELVNAKVDALDIRVTDLESTAAVPPTITIISQGASYYIPGTVLPIDEGFYNFERTYIGFSGTVGTPADLTTAISKQTPNLANLPQMMNPSLFMKNIVGWNPSPLTLAHSFNNLWLTMTDLRAKVQAIINATPIVPCILIPMETQAVTAITTYYATFEFTPTSLTTVSPPTGYLIEVFTVADTGFTSPIFAASTPNVAPVTISNPAIVADTDYVISTRVIYSCGQSARMLTTSKLLVPTILFQIKMEWTLIDTIPGQLCTDDDSTVNTYSITARSLTLTLVNKITGLPVINGSVDSIRVMVRFTTVTCGSNVNFHDQEIFIAPGNSSEMINVDENSMMKCFDGICHEVSNSPLCGVSISDLNTEFDGVTITPC